MTRLFHCAAMGSLFAVAMAAAGTAGCTPDNSVKPGAPVLTKFIIVQPNYTSTVIDASAVPCATAVTNGATCVAADDPATDEVEVPDPMCQQESSQEWCHCDASGAAPVWACSSFANVRGIVSVFDRLLDPTPLAIGPAGTPDSANDTMTADVTGGAPTPTLLTDYASNGSPSGLLLPFFAYYYYMNFRLDGPSLFTIPELAFPSGTTVTVSLNGEKVRAKDGTTPFTGGGLIADGQLSFTTPPFGFAVGPDAIAPDTTEVSVTFNNLVDPLQVAGHITVVSSTTGVVPVETAAIDGNTIGVKPAGGASWPAGATLTFTVDATTPNVLGQMLGAAAPGMVTTSAN